MMNKGGLHTAIAAIFLTLAAGGASAAGGSITVGMQLEPPNLDPTGGAAAAIDEVVYANIFEGLTRFSADGSIRPALAHSWDISEDGTVYTFHLREGVSYHDGTEFEATDVKFSLDRARDENSTNAQKALFAGIAGVEVVDPQTVKVTLSNPNGLFATNMAWGDAVILAPESVDSAATSPVGNRTVQVRSLGEGRQGRNREESRLLGRAGCPGRRRLQVHLGSNRGILRHDDGRH